MAGASGFLYSERIVLTAAHVIETSGGISYWERQGIIYEPGISNTEGQKRYRVKQVIIPKTYVAYAGHPFNIQPIDDFAILILSEDIPLTKKVMIATEDQMQRFVKEKSKVELVGYGFQNGNQRNNSWQQNMNKSPHKLVSSLSSPEMVSQFYKRYPDGLPSWWSIKDGVYGVVQNRTETGGSICDGDSGAGFFVEEKNIRYYFGYAGTGLIYNSCPPPVKPFRAPSMSWITPAYKFLDLIKTAEDIVDEDKKREFYEIEKERIAEELKARQEAELKAKINEEERLKIEAISAEIIKNNQSLARKLYAGKPCSKIRSTKVVYNIKFTCIKKNNKLVWNQGI